jgi:di/tricarboxylate transporter
MNTDLVLVLALLGAAILMFIANRPRMDAVALMMIVLLPLTGVITVNEALAGFADSSIVLIAALFVIGEGLVRTGVARRMGDWLGRVAGGSETRALILIMLAAASLGAFMSSTAVVAIFIPIVLRLCQTMGASPRGLMMPLSVAGLISGMLTLIATAPNLMVNAELTRQGLDGFGFFGVTPFGLPILAIAIVYMLWARRLLAGPAAAPTPPAARARLDEWIEQYALPDREFRLRVLPGAPIALRPLETLDLRGEGLNILAVERPRRFGGTDLLRPTRLLELEPGDILLADLQSPETDAAALFARAGLEPLPLEGGSRYFTSRSQQIGMVEALVPPESPLIGLTLLEARLRSQSGFTAIGIRRGPRPAREPLLQHRFEAGDTLLLFGFWSDLEKLRTPDPHLLLLNLPAEFDEALPAPGRAVEALACLGLTVGLMVSGIVPNVQAALIGCLLMGLFRCVDMSSAYRAISWKTIVLIVGMLPFSLALQRTGGVDLAAEALVSVAGDYEPRIVLAVLFVITAALGLFISNTATAVLMAPVAIAVAGDLGHSPYPFAMIVVLASSAAFMTPVSSTVNTIVVSPGGYGFGDFMQVGVPMAVLCLLVSVLLVPLLLPF